MSLKGFHILFIFFSALLALGCGFYCLWVDMLVGAPVYLGGVIISFASALALMIYGLWFWKKMKRLRLIT
jgi:hypothetical protein